MKLHLHHSDCLSILRDLPDVSVDAVVTDPPAGISFMGRQWDHHKGGRSEWVVCFAEIFAEVLRVAKPGAHALVWALPRTSHWTMCALEDAGWDVRDRVAHLQGQGFPKSLNLDGEWDGWGSALKPAVEDWILCRKPLNGTIASNVLEWGTGALHVDACRIATNGLRPQRVPTGRCGGRWPPNLSPIPPPRVCEGGE